MFVELTSSRAYGTRGFPRCAEDRDKPSLCWSDGFAATTRSLTCAPQKAGVASDRFSSKGLFVLLAAACLLILTPFIAVAVWGLIISIAGCSGYCNLQKLLGGRGIGSERGHRAGPRNRLDGRQAR